MVVKPGTDEVVRSGPPGVLYAWVPLGGALLLASVVVAGRAAADARRVGDGGVGGRAADGGVRGDLSPFVVLQGLGEGGGTTPVPSMSASPSASASPSSEASSSAPSEASASPSSSAGEAAASASPQGGSATWPRRATVPPWVCSPVPRPRWSRRAVTWWSGGAGPEVRHDVRAPRAGTKLGGTPLRTGQPVLRRPAATPLTVSSRARASSGSGSSPRPAASRWRLSRVDLEVGDRVQVGVADGEGLLEHRVGVEEFVARR